MHRAFTPRKTSTSPSPQDSTEKKFASLEKLAFGKKGRSYIHPDSAYTLDFVADQPYIDRRIIEEFTLIETAHGNFKVYGIEDAIADRVGHFVHWSDGEAMVVAERVAHSCHNLIHREKLLGAIRQLLPEGQAGRPRLAAAERRLLAKLN
ncbi:MAG: hypothetical protein ABR584_12440 [Candidatus Baltobacteraceae bacterium]